MIAAVAALLAVTLSVPSAPAGACDAGATLRERVELIMPALDKAKQAATAGIERGAGATETIDIFPAAYWSELLALEKSREWRAWRERWIRCAEETDGTP